MLNPDTPQCLIPWQRRRLLVPTLITLLALALIPIAPALYKFTHRALLSLPMQSFLAAAVQYASSSVTIAAIILVWTLDRSRRKLIAYFLVALFIAGNINMLVKVTAGRARPEWSVALNHKDLAVMADEENMTLEQAKGLKVDRWLWFGKDHALLEDKYNSFPSGHAVQAFALSAFLCMLYPRARLIWLIAAIGCALARVRFERHYPEDVMVGGAIGWLVSVWVFSWCWPMRVGNWFESVFGSYLRARIKKGRSGESKPDIEVRPRA